MKIAFFDTHRFETAIFDSENSCYGHEIKYLEPRLTEATVGLANGAECVCCFTNDRVNARVIQDLRKMGIKLIALRCAGFNQVDLGAAARAGIPVVRVPAYSPHAVAEHAVCLILALNRRIHRAYARVREMNFTLDGLVGFDLNGKTVGVMGTGKIGAAFARIMRGFGCTVLAFDLVEDHSLRKDGVRYVSLEELYRMSDIVSLHLPLNPATFHIVGDRAFLAMRHGAYLINTGRGALIDTKALIGALKSGQLGGAGLDVYEEEEKFFFRDVSDRVMQDDVLARLLTFPNVIITAHQGFLTREALHGIAQTTLRNVDDCQQGRELVNRVEVSPSSSAA